MQWRYLNLANYPAPGVGRGLVFVKGGGRELTEQDWYSKKDLFELIVDLKEQITGLKIEIQKTQAQMEQTSKIIQTYNGLRERLDKCEEYVAGCEGKEKGTKDTWGYIVGGIGVLLALLSFAIK